MFRFDSFGDKTRNFGVFGVLLKHGFVGFAKMDTFECDWPKGVSILTVLTRVLDKKHGFTHFSVIPLETKGDKTQKSGVFRHFYQ